MRKQYHFRPSPNGFYAWDVDRLVALTRRFPVSDFPLNLIRELDETYWYQGPDAQPTVRSIVDHFRLVNEADLSYPIILSANGGVMDGMHRVAKALLLGHATIRAVRFAADPAPDFVDVREDELPYDC